MATSTRTRAAQTSNGATATPTTVDPTTLAKQIRQVMQQQYKIKLKTRSQRVRTAIGYATREMLGSDVEREVRKVQGQQFDRTKFWERWNTKIFPHLFGQPDALKYDPETIAQALALLFDRISLEPEQAIDDLLEYNRESLRRRYQHNGQHDSDNGAEDVLDSLDDLAQPDDDLVGLDDEEL